MKMSLVTFVSKSEGARYSDVNEVTHTESVHIGCLKRRMLLYEMHSIVNGTWSPFFPRFRFANDDQGAAYRVLRVGVNETGRPDWRPDFQ